ncbi:hypothetical protein ACHAXS_011652 [Conticribra weissflogii]
MTSPWQPPYWSCPPASTDTWTLDEIKHGNIIASYSLNEILSENHPSRRGAAITFGRIDDPSAVDIVTAHESCSRLHARISFDKSGTPWLRDLGSGNGTFVNRRRLPKDACGKLEIPEGAPQAAKAGSRGVILYPGDAIQFGASTRMYCLEGPPEFERGAVKLKKEQNKAKVAQHVDEIEKNENDYEAGCSWGISDDIPDEEGDTSQQIPIRDGTYDNLPSMESFFSSTSSKYSIPSSLHQLYKTFQTKSNKLHAIQIESSRILQKENMGVELSDGQTKQLEKNQDRIDKLEKDILELKERIEDGIHDVVHGGGSSSKKRKRQKSHEENGGRAGHDDDVDDFYDRTADSDNKRKRNSSDGVVETEQSLTAKWKSIYSSHCKQQELVKQASTKCAYFQSQIDNSKGDDDADDFFIQNDLALAYDNLSTVKAALEDTEKEMTEVESLLKIVNSKLDWDRGDGWIGVGGTKLKSDDTIVNDTEKKKNVTDSNDAEDLMSSPPPNSLMPPPPMKINAACNSFSTQEIMASPSSSNGSWQQRVIEPAKPPKLEGHSKPSSNSSIDIPWESCPKRQLGPMRPPGHESASSEVTQTASESKPRKKANIASHGTLAALQHVVNVASDAHSSTQQQMKSQPIAKPFDPRKDEWSAPKDQDGSGRTSLHDKFKGRY